MARLSYAQWQAGPKKSGSYAAYTKWYNKNIAPPRDPTAPLTQRQLDAQIADRLAAVYGPQRQQIEQETASRTATIQAASQAAAALLQSHVGATQGAYSQATKDIAGLGGGYSDAMKARLTAVQQTASDFAGQQGQQAAPGTDVAALGDTLYQGGVNIPGSSLAAQGAAASALENAQAGIPLLQGAQDIRQNMQDSEKALLELAQKRPELRQQISDALYQHEMDKLKVRIQQQAQDLYQSQFGEKTRHDLATEKAATRRNQISYQRVLNQHNDAINKAAAEGVLPNASLSRAYGYIVDKHGRPILDGNGKKMPVAKSTSAKSAKQKSQAQYGKAVGEAGKMFTDRQPTPPSPSNGYTAQPPKRLWRWPVALNFLMNKYGITRSRARQALVAAGFKPPASRSPGRGPGGTGPR